MWLRPPLAPVGAKKRGDQFYHLHDKMVEITKLGEHQQLTVNRQ
jgi:hypothetical protein